ncbi:MAG: hypothetical protein LBT04_10270 [Prevotellaceae bacterium]|jgi:hypothetical protein|nr:hypothetical protein [Prevotellaceae bacterium]
MYYYGLKLHLLAFRRKGTIPFSTAVSKVRQPIESFFNRLIEKSNIQNASKVRSTNGLWLHCLGKIAIACIAFIF